MQAKHGIQGPKTDEPPPSPLQCSDLSSNESSNESLHEQAPCPFPSDSVPSHPPSREGSPGANHDIDIDISVFDSDHIPPGSYIEGLTRNSPPRDDLLDEHIPPHVPRPDPPGVTKGVTCVYHTKLNGQICDEDGNDIPSDTLAPPRNSNQGPNDWMPYNNRLEFEVADVLYRHNQMSARDINCLLTLWAASLSAHNGKPPFANAAQMYSAIDSTPLGDTPWQSFSLQYNGIRSEGNIVSWQEADYNVWFRNPRTLVHGILSNPDFKSDFDLAPLQEHTPDGTHRFCDFMSGNWAWRQATIIAEDPETHGSVFCPMILSSDKTTVSVATGHNKYWPIYLSIGNIHNIRQAHRNGVVLLGFFAIPKSWLVCSTHEFRDNPKICRFHHQLLHSSLAKILEPLRPGMTTPEVVHFSDDHFRKVIYGLGPHIADYPEQALLACVVQGWCARCTAPANDLDSGQQTLQKPVPHSQAHTEILVEEFELGVLWDEYGLPFTHYFPRADINELLSPDLLHQLIKGAFKDHLVTWVNEYIEAKYPASQAQKILNDIDQRHFPEGQNFKQWTGDDSKALMKVYLPAIQGHIPDEMVLAMHAFLEFCYIAQRDIHDTCSLGALDNALKRFHCHREIFWEVGVHIKGFNLPRQHSLVHYTKLIHAYGAPNGLCSSITESKHIKAVKEPWRCSNHFDVLSQMLLTNQRLDKLAAACVDFTNRGMNTGRAWVNPSHEPLISDSSSLLGNSAGSGNGNIKEDEDNDDADIASPTVEAHVDLSKIPLCKVYPDDITTELAQPDFPRLIQKFIYDQEHVDSASDIMSISSTAHPTFYGKITVYPSAIATFHAPSDISGTGGMHCKCICAVTSWRKGAGRYDTVFVNADSAVEGMRGLYVAHMRLFFSFSFEAEMSTSSRQMSVLYSTTDTCNLCPALSQCRCLGHCRPIVGVASSCHRLVVVLLAIAPPSHCPVIMVNGHWPVVVLSPLSPRPIAVAGVVMAALAGCWVTAGVHAA
ncbi:hypothetical protein EDB85DRAFT_1893036 [Lactarius pseudohatsudake]|nr:hypothetical protein EDB85DRAFT_1893036 [Lactarius pseudohatsudake]